MTKPGEKEYRARLEQQRIRHQKEKIAKEEQKRREMVARPSPMVFSKPLQKRANLKWVEERLEMAMTKAKKRKRNRKKLLNSFLESEEIERQKNLEEEAAAEAKKKLEDRKNPLELLETYRLNRKNLLK